MWEFQRALLPPPEFLLGRASSGLTDIALDPTFDSTTFYTASVGSGVDQITIEVTENSVSVTFTVKITSHPVGGAPKLSLLQVNTADGTAVSPDDYRGTSSELIQL